ncbi:hypothetical protein ABFS83_05G059700 [Erythranthe nasuta]
MEDSFRVRVDKTFGTLGGNTASSAGVSPSLWSLTDEEIERREWILNNKEEAEGGESGPSDRLIQLDADLINDLSDCEEDEQEAEAEEEEEEEEEEEDDAIAPNSVASAETAVDEYLDVRSNIGRDCTLDYEEEEDQYDKVAVGKEQTGDRLYMRDVKSADYGIYENDYEELPNTLQTVYKDPRANHSAAKIRLKEDAETAGNFDTLQLTDNSEAMNVVKPDEDIKRGETTDGGDNPKPILKKRENLIDSKSQKRVRFIVDPTSSVEAGGSDLEVPKQAPDLSPLPSAPDYVPSVPDYLLNPSKYTRYTFDPSDDMDDRSNQTAFMELFFNRSSKAADTGPSMDETSAEIPKSIVFTPRRKQRDDSMEHDLGEGDNNNLKKNKGLSVVIAAAEDIGEGEVSAMEEDERCEGSSGSQKAGRKYRARTTIVDAEDTLN